ncbi:ABC transporter permease [Streptococcus catagoni]|uniref:ABC transporter permease n=1 Tax=Streptococcus catagoni TaxID=2654874 RepID=UPI00140883EF|nr:ABC transporter permease [Streptococcus catagoni]
MFYLKLAWNNLKNSFEVLAPFFLASTVLFMLNCIVTIILFSPISKKMSYGNTFLGLAFVILTLFATIMEIYSYNFFLKQRSREFGLYNILGMNKGQVGLVSTLELIMMYIATVFLGCLSSYIFSHLFYLIFVNLTHYDSLDLPFNFLPFLITTAVFLAIFILLEILGLRKIRKTSPLLLFQDQHQGEKEPRGHFLLAVLSLLSLGMGYYLSFSSTKVSALVVLYRFFIAVILVIIGTYLFYISFMAWYLKRKKANKNYYYQSKHFISTSQMIFRMRQNALGLANITILAVMAFVAIATTTALYTNTNNSIKELFPKNTTFNFETANEKEVKDYVSRFILTPLNKKENELIQYKNLRVGIPGAEGKKLKISKTDFTKPNFTKITFTHIVSEEDYLHLGNKKLHLADGQVAYFKQKGDSQLKTMDILDQHYQVKENIKSINFPAVVNTYNPAVLVVKDEETLNTIIKKINSVSQVKLGLEYTVFGNFSQKELNRILDNTGNLSHDKQFIAQVTQKKAFKRDLYNMFGGFMFAGFLMGSAFILGAALIIYYKQYSEGHEDKKSYQILQEVGMSQKQIKQTINSQILLVFFMPITMAVIHFSVAIIMLKQMLLMFGVTSSPLIYKVSGITIAIIIVIYFMIYKTTSKAYYKIIER